MALSPWRDTTTVCHRPKLEPANMAEYLDAEELCVMPGHAVLSRTGIFYKIFCVCRKVETIAAATYAIVFSHRHKDRSHGTYLRSVWYTSDWTDME